MGDTVILTGDTAGTAPQHCFSDFEDESVFREAQRCSRPRRRLSCTRPFLRNDILRTQQSREMEFRVWAGGPMQRGVLLCLGWCMYLGVNSYVPVVRRTKTKVSVWARVMSARYC